MAQEEYHGRDMTISITTEAGTSITIGIFHECEIVGQVEVDEQYGADSIERQNVKQREHKVQVRGTIGGWDTALLQQWLGGSGASSTGMVDTSDPALFEVTGQVTPAGGSTDLKAVVEEVYFPEMPIFSLSEDAWAEKEIEGTGARATVTGP